MKRLVIFCLVIFMLGALGNAFAYTNKKYSQKDTTVKKEPTVNFTWGDDSASVAKARLNELQLKKKKSASTTYKSKKKYYPKKDSDKKKDSPQWLENMREDFRKIFLFEE